MGTKMPLGLSLLFLLCVCCSLFSTHVPRASSLSFNLSFSDPASACGVQINCTNTYIDGGMLELTRNDIDRGTIDSIGRATYAKPVPLWRAGAGGGAKLLASFTTSFTFRIKPDPMRDTGDGMAFFLTPYPSATEIPPGSGGGNLGLLAGGNSTGDSRFVFVAVEFDTWSNGPPADINGNHMGIDNTSIVSMVSTSTSSPTGNLTSNINMTATISYHNGSKLLTADLLINGSSYHVNATIDLSSYLPEEVAVGFSASTGLSAEQHRVLTWSFSSTLASSETTATTTHVDGTSNKLPKKLRLLLSVLVPILLFLSLCAAGTSFLVRRRRRRRHEANGSSSDSEEQFDRAELERGVAAGGPKRYTYAELANTTNNFAEEKKLGRGGFGSVYLGQLNVAGQDRAVAIKMFSSESSAQGRREFEAEVRIISRLKHRNLVQLLGWCDSRNGLMLVYELVAKGSLDRHLYSRDTFLTWPERYEIVLGLGSALRYLHKEWEQCIVHGDIKPSNIMLDESHGTKLGDFGLARLVDHGAGWQTTKAVLGTAGYIDPEFVNTRRPSTYSDVYSFGIVLLEIICNRPPVVMPKEAGEEQQPFVLLKWVWGLYGQNATLDAADERLRGDELDELCMERVLVVGLWCAHPDPSERPSIEQAMHVLQSEDKRLLPALPPQMYKTTLDVPIPARAYGALSIDAYSSSTCSSATTGNTNPSSESSSSALLRSSHDLP